MADATPATIDRATAKINPCQALLAGIPMWGQLVPASPGGMLLDMFVGQDEWTIGRHATCDFIFPDPKISNRHCVLSWDPDRAVEVLVKDLSTNGTFINDDRIGKGNRMELRNGDELRISTDDNPSDQTGNCHRYIYRHLWDPCGQSMFDEFTLFSAEIATHARELRWKAIRTRDRQTCAAVVILPPREARGSISSMRVEATRLMDEPAHPNVLSILAAFAMSSSLQIVTERCEGETLQIMMFQHPAGLDEARTRSLSRDVCSGLQYLHARRVFVPSLLPESVLVVSGRRATIDVTRSGFPDYSALLRVHPGSRPSPLLSPEWPFDYLNPPGVGNVWSAGILGALMLTGRFNLGGDPAGYGNRIGPRAPIDWDALDTKSAEAQDWVRGMLQNDRHERMTLPAALEHPWLREAALPA